MTKEKGMDAKISAAFELVNAYAKEKSHDAQRALLEKYSHLRKAAAAGAKDMMCNGKRWMLIGGIAASATVLGLVAAKMLKKNH